MIDVIKTEMIENKLWSTFQGFLKITGAYIDLNGEICYIVRSHKNKIEEYYCSYDELIESLNAREAGFIQTYDLISHKTVFTNFLAKEFKCENHEVKSVIINMIQHYISNTLLVLSEEDKTKFMNIRIDFLDYFMNIYDNIMFVTFVDVNVTHQMWIKKISNTRNELCYKIFNYGDYTKGEKLKNDCNSIEYNFRPVLMKINNIFRRNAENEELENANTGNKSEN